MYTPDGLKKLLNRKEIIKDDNGYVSYAKKKKGYFLYALYLKQAYGWFDRNLVFDGELPEKPLRIKVSKKRMGNKYKVMLYIYNLINYDSGVYYMISRQEKENSPNLISKLKLKITTIQNNIIKNSKLEEKLNQNKLHFS